MPVLLLSMIVIVIDQWTKYYIQTRLVPGDSIPVISEIFHITLVLNPGAAFGLLEHQRFFFVIIAIVMLLGVAFFYPRIPHDAIFLRIGIGLMTGGAIGNVIDRIKTGLVVDFFDFRIWPVFNIADIAIVSGVSMIIYSMLYLSEEEDGRT